MFETHDFLTGVYAQLKLSNDTSLKLSFASQTVLTKHTRRTVSENAVNGQSSTYINHIFYHRT